MRTYTTPIVLGVFLVVVGLNWSRFSRNAGEPALLSTSTGVWVQLGYGFPDPGMNRQIDDGDDLTDVINLTGMEFADNAVENIIMTTPLRSGQRIDLIMQGAEIQSISLSWMSAAQRIVLGVPLHPDQMTQADWEFLPGIGVKMAARIEMDRQKNGDFGSFSALRRIKGVGARKMAAWKDFF